ncbi:16S rRNA (uracil(1498)-N(3))-methyltransferase [Oleiagrimonas soli]|uniref:Ribosomal RNA small subunit methyltransferase E n=1 Tax=Oleiagrimonas soli TaxID=1543381 RepID=A0A099CY90_9GAMM|nr:16S rRNA (uracil(1498)-N(3))-methyltransferase [Oleiagrimonas soli]KGI78631.1 16S rRNA methyltransferase [Oleiagrimonas soli]MBB6184070.1 16S rRNA (uracil1498-N3)-methyltransferase [Oleiagrimonas soli]
MRRIRLHVDLPLQAHTRIALPDSAAEHAVRVLRMRDGDPVTLFNGDGHDYEGALENVGKRNADVALHEATPVANESPLTLTLAQAIARGEKMDWIVQKATELGVTRIVPLHTERSEVRLDERRAEKRLAHWQAVAISACEQSGRARVPLIEPAQSLTTWLGALQGDAARLALLPEQGKRTRDLTLTASAALLAVGPEGGWGERDLDALRGAGFQALQLGPRVLRTETAGLTGLAALQTQFGDL